MIEIDTIERSWREALEVAATIAENHPVSDEYVPHKAIQKAAGRAIAAKIRALAKELE